jgi:hypothetical protein
VFFHDPASGSTTRDSFSIAAGGANTLALNGTTWNNIALVRGGTNLAVWVNGVNVGSTTLASGYNLAVNTETWFREFQFGARAAVTGASIDDAGIWHRALSETELSQIYNGGAGQTIGNLSAVPEPSTYGVMGAGALAAVALVRRRRKR